MLIGPLGVPFPTPEQIHATAWSLGKEFGWITVGRKIKETQEMLDFCAEALTFVSDVDNNRHDEINWKAYERDDQQEENFGIDLWLIWRRWEVKLNFT